MRPKSNINDNNKVIERVSGWRSGLIGQFSMEICGYLVGSNPGRGGAFFFFFLFFYLLVLLTVIPIANGFLNTHSNEHAGNSEIEAISSTQILIPFRGMFLHEILR
jgi:hypothetical protein